MGGEYKLRILIGGRLGYIGEGKIREEQRNRGCATL